MEPAGRPVENLAWSKRHATKLHASLGSKTSSSHTPVQSPSHCPWYLVGRNPAVNPSIDTLEGEDLPAKVGKELGQWGAVESAHAPQFTCCPGHVRETSEQAELAKPCKETWKRSCLHCGWAQKEKAVCKEILSGKTKINKNKTEVVLSRSELNLQVWLAGSLKMWEDSAAYTDQL